MNEAVALLNAISPGWGAICWRVSWQGALAVLFIWSLCGIWRTMPPAWQCWLWRAVYLKILLSICWAGAIVLPVRSLLVPAVTVRHALPPRVAGVYLPTLSVMAAPRVAPVAARPSLPTVLCLLWLAGLAGYGVRLLRGWRTMRQLRWCCRELDDPALRDGLADICARLRVRRVPSLRVGTVAGPLLVGMRHPIIILPESLHALCTPREIQLILEHEVAHLARHDLWWAWLPSLCNTAGFFHPLLHLAHREWRMAQEMACDALVLAHGDAASAGEIATAYSTVLLKVAGWQSHISRTQMPAIGFADNFRTLKRRLVTMNTPMKTTRLRMVLAGATLSLIATLGLAPWRVMAETAAPPPADATNAAASATVTPPVFLTVTTGQQPAIDNPPFAQSAAGSATNRPPFPYSRGFAGMGIQGGNAGGSAVAATSARAIFGTLPPGMTQAQFQAQCQRQLEQALQQLAKNAPGQPGFQGGMMGALGGCDGACQGANAGNSAAMTGVMGVGAGAMDAEQMRQLAEAMQNNPGFTGGFLIRNGVVTPLAPGGSGQPRSAMGGKLGAAAAGSRGTGTASGYGLGVAGSDADAAAWKQMVEQQFQQQMQQLLEQMRANPQLTQPGLVGSMGAPGGSTPAPAAPPATDGKK